MTLEHYRAEIDNIDKQLKDLFSRRLKVVEQVADYKLQTGDKILKREREKQIIDEFAAGMEQEERLEFTSFIKKIMEVSRTHQYRRMIKLGRDFQFNANPSQAISRVCYQGLPGSYSEKAADDMFEMAEKYPVNTFEEVFLEIKQGHADTGILPMENTTAGTIEEVYDLLIRHDLYINQSAIVKVDHCHAMKFIAISKKLIVTENHNRIAIVFSCPHVGGSLADVLGIFGDYGINLTEIHSKPYGKNSWQYLFYVDFTSNLMEESLRALFYQLTEELPFVKLLGSYEGSL